MKKRIQTLISMENIEAEREREREGNAKGGIYYIYVLPPSRYVSKVSQHKYVVPFGVNFSEAVSNSFGDFRMFLLMFGALSTQVMRTVDALSSILQYYSN